jgi:hypothetical protein
MYCPNCKETDTKKFLLTSKGKDWCTSCGWKEGTILNNSKQRMKRLKPKLPDGQMELSGYG